MRDVVTMRMSEDSKTNLVLLNAQKNSSRWQVLTYIKVVILLERERG